MFAHSGISHTHINTQHFAETDRDELAVVRLNDIGIEGPHAMICEERIFTKKKEVQASQ